MIYETAGNPISGLLWTKKSSRKISNELLNTYNTSVCPKTVCGILKEMGYSLKVNYKKIENNKIITPEQKYYRNQQFLYIAKKRNFYKKHKLCIISVDGKKKEHIGNFINIGDHSQPHYQCSMS